MVMGQDLHDGIRVLIEIKRDQSSFSSLCEDTGRRHPSIIQEEAHIRN